jgi:hypothetical protein
MDERMKIETEIETTHEEILLHDDPIHLHHNEIRPNNHDLCDQALESRLETLHDETIQIQLQPTIDPSDLQMVMEEKDHDDQTLEDEMLMFPTTDQLLQMFHDEKMLQPLVVMTMSNLPILYQ